MTEITTEQRGVIERKLQYLNRVLQSAVDEDIPKLSISVGIAVSEHGFNDSLFEKADGAIYRTMERGRCGYTFA